MLRNSRKSLISLVGLLALAGAAWATFGANVADRGKEPLALFGTVPIYWGESASLEETLSGAVEAHWARAVLEQRFVLTPLDTLSKASLAGHSRLLMAQPRALSPEENVALDNWVRAGGQVILFADPLLTAHSRFGLGDRRRPQDVILMSPILARWGLELQFDDRQVDGLQVSETDFGLLPVEMVGSLASLDQQPDQADRGQCSLVNAGMIATCSIGSGFALIIADATLFDVPEGEETLLQMASAKRAED